MRLTVGISCLGRCTPKGISIPILNNRTSSVPSTRRGERYTQLRSMTTTDRHTAVESKDDEMMEFLKSVYREVEDSMLELQMKQGPGVIASPVTWKKHEENGDASEELLLGTFLKLNRFVKVRRVSYEFPYTVFKDLNEVHGHRRINLPDLSEPSSFKAYKVEAFFANISQVKLRSHPDIEKKINELFISALSYDILSMTTINRMILLLSDRYNFKIIQTALDTMTKNGMKPGIMTYNIFLNRLTKSKMEYRRTTLINQFKLMNARQIRCDHLTWYIVFRSLEAESNRELMLEIMRRNGFPWVQEPQYLERHTDLNTFVQTETDQGLSVRRYVKLLLNDRRFSDAYKYWQEKTKTIELPVDQGIMHLFIKYSIVVERNIPLAISFIKLFEFEYDLQNTCALYTIIMENFTCFQYFVKWPIYARLVYQETIDTFDGESMVSESTIDKINSIGRLRDPNFDVTSPVTEKELLKVKSQASRVELEKLVRKFGTVSEENRLFYTDAIERLGYEEYIGLLRPVR